MTEQPITAILIDVGNSNTRVAGWRGSDHVVLTGPPKTSRTLRAIERIGECSTPDDRAEEEQNLVAFLSPLIAEPTGLPVALVSVVPRVAALIRKICPRLIVIDHTCHSPFRMAVDEPAQMGADRLCNMAAAAAAGLSDAIVVDVGTATTVDVLHEGAFVGGLIAPGMASAGASLSSSTAQLPEVSFAECEMAPGKSTAEAMRRGIFHSGVGGVEALISGLEKQFGGSIVIVTGGLGGALVTPERWHDPDWTFRGAAKMAQLF